ncbi:MAG: cupin domain-containing protein [Steroidobacteraceae bacterium]
MSSASGPGGCGRAARVSLYALGLLPTSEAPELELHIAECTECRQQMQRLQPVIDTLADRRRDVLRPPELLWERLAQRIAPAASREQASPPATAWPKPQWMEVAPGISCKLLATDTQRSRISMLVRLAPGVQYPPHRHADVEELHLLDGELWIDDRKLCPGDYNRAGPGSCDQRVWSETGCTCVLVTSSLDIIF